MVENNASRTISTVSTRPLLFMFGITLRCRSSGFRAEAGLSLGDVRPLPKEECSPNHVPSSLPRRRPPWRSAQWGPPASPLGGAPMGRAQEGPARRGLNARFDLGRDQPNFIDTRCVGDVDDLCHIVEGQLGISLDEHDFFGAGLEDVVEAAFQILPRHVVLVDFERRLIAAASQYLHHNSAVVAWRLLLLVLGRLGNQRVQTFWSQRCDHHEDDEQHQQDVNHWRYVDVGSGTLAGPPHCHTHKELPLLGASARAGTGCGRLFPAAPVCLCSVNRPTSSTPAERTLSTTSTTAPYLARASALIKTRLSTLLARRSFTLAVSWSALTLSVPKKICPSRMMATSKESSLSASCMGTGLLTLAMSTLTPFCTMGVMTMKMMRTTSITSTMGVTLMLELTFLPSSRTAIAIIFNLLQTGVSAN